MQGSWGIILLLVVVPCSTALRMKGPTDEEQDKRVMHKAMVFDKIDLLKLDLLDGCRTIFLDIGANVGVHVREVFEGAKYPKSKLRSTFNTWFGDEGMRGKPSIESGVCALGFEANPRIAPRLHDIEGSYAQKGWKAIFFAPQVVSDKDGNVTFYMNDEPQNNDWGSSVVDRSSPSSSRQFVEVTVPALDFPALVQNELMSRRGGNGIQHVYAKMDIESSEFLVLPGMLDRKALCKGLGIDAMTIEWHEDRITPPEGSRWVVRQDVIKAVEDQTCEATELVPIDDEEYLFDPEPLPDGKRMQTLDHIQVKHVAEERYSTIARQLRLDE